MSTFGIVTAPASRRRRIIFTIVAGGVAVAFLTATPNVLAPWMIVNRENLPDPAQARWSVALEGVVDLLAVVLIVAALYKPARSALLVQYVLYAAVLAAAVIIPFSGWSFLAVAAVLLLVPLTYPYPRELFSLRSKSRPSVVLLAVAVIAAGILMPLAIQAIGIQATLPRADSQLAANAEHLLLLALAGLLAATRRPGWRVIASAVTVVYAYLGLASFLLPNQPNSWGTAGGTVSLLASAAFGITAVIASRGDKGDMTAPRSVLQSRSQRAPASGVESRDRHGLGQDSPLNFAGVNVESSARPARCLSIAPHGGAAN